MTPTVATAPHAPARTPLGVKLLAVPAVVAVLIGGLWFWSAIVAKNYWVSIGAGVAWFIVISMAAGRLTKRRRDLKLPIRATFIVTAVTVSALFYWTSIRSTTVNERVVTGTPARELQARAPATGAPAATPRPAGNVQVARGSVESLAHEGRGTVAVVQLPNGGRRLTLTSFEISPGPQVEVRLVAGTNPRGGNFKNLGGLKGDRGNQQYRIPAGVDVNRYGLVVFWCVPFKQALAKAQLDPA